MARRYYGDNTPSSSNTGGSYRGIQNEVPYDSDTSQDSKPRSLDATLELLGLENGRSGYGQILGSLGKNSDITDFLLTLLQSGNDIKDKIGTNYDEFMKMLVEMYLKNLTAQEQRNYDKSALAEQRLYDTPLNQLARLMSTGMSRDAALQALQGTSDAPLVGSGADASLPSQMASPTETLMQGLNTAVGFLGAVTSMVGLGFTIPQALAQTDFLKTQAYLTTRQKQAFDASSQAFGILQNAGTELTTDTFGNIASVSKAITALADGGNVAAQAFVKNGGLQQLNETSPYSLPILNQMYKDHRNPRDYKKEFELRTGNEEADLNLKEVQTANILVAMTAIQDQVDNLRANTQYQQALSALVGSQKTQVDLANQLDATWRTPEGLEAYTGATIEQFKFNAKKLAKMNELGLWEEQAKTMLSNEKFAQLSLELDMLYTSGAIDITQNAPKEQQDLFNMCTALQECHYFDYLHAIVEEKTAGNIKLPLGFGFTTRATSYFDKTVNPWLLFTPTK